MATISYLRGPNFGGAGVIPFGCDVLVVTIVGLFFYGWGVSQGITDSDVVDHQAAFSTDKETVSSEGDS